MASKKKVSLNDYDLTTTLGTGNLLNLISKGSFGRVRLARNKKTGDYYAMKILKKADIIKLKQVDHVISENTILADIDHPFLVQLFQIILSGRIKRILLGSEIPIFLDGLHSWWRIIHIS
jgi:serine/threonine protein kinase